VKAVYLLRTVAREVEAGAAEVVSGYILEDIGLLFPKMKLGDGGAGTLAVRRGKQELNNAIRVRVGERLEQNRVHNRENRGVDPDAQRKRSNGGKSESRIRTEHAHRMLEVVPEIAHASLLDVNIRRSRK
jgi:hypothetical protein